MTVNIVEAKPLPSSPPERGITRTSNKPNIPTAALHTLKNTYYHDNFNFLIKFVSDHYWKLLLQEEQEFLQRYTTLSVDAQQLFVRLALRTPAYLRLSKIRYAEFEVAPVLKKLGKVGLINLNIDSIEHCLPLFARHEVSSALGVNVSEVPSIDSPSWTTPDLFGDSPISKLFSNDSVIEVNYKQTIQTFKLLFFGNLHQDFSSFVLRDLGYQRFESYEIECNNLLFDTREQIDSHLAYYNCVENFHTACESNVGGSPGVDTLIELHNALPPRIENDKVLCRRLNRLNNKLARQLERESALETAADIYSKSVLPPARERLARIQSKIDNPERALEICRQIIHSPCDSDELDFAYSFGHRLAKKLEQSFPVNKKHKPPESTITLARSNLSVEHSVATHFAKTGKCYYLENNLISGVFGLAFWDIIFAPVNGVFFHPFQSKPSDFYEPEFVSSRKTLIARRLEDISKGMLNQVVNSHIYHKRSIQNPMVNWPMCRKHIIDQALKRIPADTWTTLFNQILLDIRNYRSGQPDLAYFPDTGGYQFIEVKGPGDKLQKNQHRWMDFFAQQNIPHQIVNVEWSDSLYEAN